MVAEKTIEIPEIRLARMVVTIEGQTPLIVHRFGERSRREIEDKQQHKARNAKAARDPEAEFKDALYVIDEQQGRYGFPAAGVKKALVYAGGRFTSAHMTVLRGALNVLGDFLEIKGSKPSMRSDTVKLQNGKIASIAYRPMFMPWEMEVPVVYNATMLSEAMVLNLFQHAGFAIGLGAWRPEKNGTFGQFIIKEGGVKLV